MTCVASPKSALLGSTITTIAALSVAGAAILSGGCGSRTSALPPSRFLSDNLQDTPPATADFSRPFTASLTDIEQGEDAGLPVAAARSLSNSAGGTWVVVAPDALDPVKGFDSSNPYAMMRQSNKPSVADQIDTLRKAGTPIAYDTTHGYVFMVFGDQADLARWRAAPPEPITGLYLRSATLQSAITALADSRRERIDLDPQLDAAWTAYKKRSAGIQTALNQNEMGNGPAMAMELMMVSGLAPGVDFEFSNVRRASEADLINGVARAAGGAAVQTGPSQWRIAAFTSGPSLDTELKRLKSVIDQSNGTGGNTSGEDAGAGTSYAQRRGEDTTSSASADSAAMLSSDSPDAVQTVEAQIAQLTISDPAEAAAQDELGVIGPPALATLAAYLTPTSPPAAACGALRVLASESPDLTAARDAYYKYIDATLATPPKTGQEVQRAAVISYTLNLLSATSTVDGSLDRRAQDFLDKTAAAPNLPRFIRKQARFTLLRYGVMPSPPGNAPAWNPAAERAFTLTPPPVGRGLLQPVAATPPNAIHPLASVALPTGDAWAVFVSGRLGNAQDIWLAHATGGVWREFLFTGKQYQTTQGYNTGSPIQPGGCTIAVTGDSIVIKPAKSQMVAKLNALQTLVSKMAQTDPKKAMQIANQLSQLQQNAGSSLGVTYTLSLAQQRKDSDGDGLTDLAEKRLMTDPRRRDTGGNGIGDEGDQNPLVKNTAATTGDRDRRAMLQQIFSALYGGDTDPSPIVVVIDKAFQQSFQGGVARVLCMTPRQYAIEGSNYTALRSLQFGGPTDQAGTILHADGPCLFSDDGDRAEVHFWTSSPLQPVYANQAGMGSDSVALFERAGAGWTLKSISPWRFRTSASAEQSRTMQGY